MTNALFFTVTDRMDYTSQALESWSKVRGIQRWKCVARIEPSPRKDEMADMFRLFFETMMIPDFEIIINDRVLGAPNHPRIGFSELFQAHDFVLYAEDDEIVSDDVLEYVEWAEETYRNTKGVATIHTFSPTHGDSADVELRPQFNSWLWGTWRSVWDTVLEPLWDGNYSTFNGYPGNEAGWDWNIRTRLFPKYGYVGVFPVSSRADNIGLWGVHGTPENHQTAPSFKPVYGVQDYRELS